MQFLVRFLFVALLALLEFPAHSQSRVLGRPNVYDVPEYGRRYTAAELKDHSKDIPWLVIVDRAGAKAYAQPNEGAASVPLDFRDYFYVVDTDGDWLKLVKCTPNGLKIAALEREVGWVRRENLLEWTTGLRSPHTRVHQKTFLFTRPEFLADVLRRPDGDNVDVYADPTGKSKLRPLSVNAFYFILKKENGYYLLCQEEQFSIFDMKGKIVGWVHQNRCSDWNTRIVLEPNFQPEAFAERKANPKLRVKAYTDFVPAAEHGKTGQPPQSQVIWENDPVLLPPSQLVGNRYPGQVMRFPLYTSGEVDQRLEIFSSSAIADMVVGGRQPGQERLGTVNVFFLIEGSVTVTPAKTAIERVIQKMADSIGSDRLRVGALIYRHPAEESTNEGNKMLETQPLSTDFAQTIAFIRATKFKRWKNASAFACPFYALQAAIRKAGFREGETNLIFLVGNSPDYRANEEQREQYRSHISAVDENALAQELLQAQAQIFVAQTADSSKGSALVAQIQTFGGKAGLVRGTFLPQSFSPFQLAEHLFAETRVVCAPAPEQELLAADIGGGISCGLFSPSFSSSLREEAAQQGLVESDQRQRYTLLSKAYFPRQVAGAKYPMFSYVAFMSEGDVRDYRNTINRFVRNPPPTADEKRSALIELYLGLLKTFTGRDFNEGVEARKEFEQMERRQILEHINGVAGAGLDFDVPMNVKMSCILDQACMSDAQVLALFGRMAKVIEYLDSLLRGSEPSASLSFKPTAIFDGYSLYHWIPIEDLF